MDGRFTRSDTAVKAIPVDAGYLEFEAEGFFLDYGGGTIAISAAVNVDMVGTIRNSSQFIEVSRGKHLYNEIRYTTYPVYVDPAATTVLFSLNNPIQISAGGTVSNILGRYRDPSGGASRVSGTEMVAPVATTDYLFNSNYDGSGSNWTAFLQVTANYGTEGVNYTLVNTGGTAGYVTKLQARGKGIYNYDPVTLAMLDEDSQAVHGTRILELDLKYEKNIDTATTFANIHLDQYKDPKTLVESVRFLANREYYSMYTFLGADIGDKFQLSDELSAISSDLFINAIEFEVLPGGIIFVNYTPAFGGYDAYDFWVLDTVGDSELGEETFLGF